MDSFKSCSYVFDNTLLIQLSLPSRLLPGERVVKTHHLVAGDAETVTHEVPDGGVLGELARAVREPFRHDVTGLRVQGHAAANIEVPCADNTQTVNMYTFLLDYDLQRVEFGIPSAILDLGPWIHNHIVYANKIAIKG